MASTTAPPQSVRSRRWRNFRLGAFTFLALVVALIVFALFRPLTLLWYGTETRLLFAGVHSDYTHIELPGVGRVRIHYYAGGSGDPIVLVHGLGGRAEDWANLMPRLVHDHHRVYALDLPGYGRSDWPTNASYSIREEADAVEAFMNDRHLTHSDLGGWSMGGWLAMRVALDQPQRIRRLMIFDSAGTRFSLIWDPAIFEPDTPQKLQEMDNLLMPDGAPHIPAFIEHAIFRFVKQHGWVVRRNMDSLLTGKDLLDGKLGALQMPMLIVWGKEDHLIPVSVGRQIHHDVPQSELEVFDGCGHLAAAQCAAQVGPVVRGFLDEPSPIPGQTAEIGRKR
ncbi:MAG TPA: alpha/beta fold hydrolase [Acidobacteriaceae bacterium]|nr:alpha/beta fold hydrolase [Acidobacteriaceae bacterium]